MRTLTLNRKYEIKGATIGRLDDETGGRICFTLEHLWVDLDGNGIGDRMVSRIPAGEYVCKRDKHGKSKPNPYEVWEVNNVPGRSEVHIHIGNGVEHTLGCILVGEQVNGDRLEHSRDAFAALMAETAGEREIYLIVKDF
jgi:hypothetical protein